jgi:hypothetical protein
LILAKIYHFFIFFPTYFRFVFCGKTKAHPIWDGIDVLTMLAWRFAQLKLCRYVVRPMSEASWESKRYRVTHWKVYNAALKA